MHQRSQVQGGTQTPSVEFTKTLLLFTQKFVLAAGADFAEFLLEVQQVS